MEEVVEQLLRSPKFGIYFDQLSTAFANEKAARAKFLDEITEDDKAEFINGKAFFQSPVCYAHNEARMRLSLLASMFVDTHHLGKVGDEKLMISLTRNDYEPDISFWRTEISSTFASNQMRFPAPDWIV